MYRPSKSSKSKSKRYGEYSDWVWESDQQFWYRVRQDAEGNLDYDYGPSSGQEVPRTGDEAVDDLTQDYANLALQTDPQDSEYSTSGGQTAGSTGRGRSSKSSKGKDKRYDRYEGAADEPRDSRRQPVVDEGTDYAYTTGVGDAGYATGDAYYQEPYPSGAGSSSRSSGAYASADSGYATTEAGFDAAYGASATAHDPYGGSSSAYAAYPAYEPGDEDGRLTPRAGSSSKTSHLATDVEALDPRYRVERSDRFQPGEIFKAGWAEPKGAANDMLTGLSGKQEIEDTRGVTFITGFRRFIVVANDQGHATCVPILSYGGKACKKHGVKAEKHGIIYQRGQRPKLLDGEPKLGFPPVKMDITMEGEKISKESRVNYSKLVTVEHNVKVMFIGTIVAQDWPIVPDAINRCWDQKDHHKRSRHRR